MRIDHVVLWVEDPSRSLDFFVNVLGLEGVRVEEYRSKKTMFPSVRVSEDSILDLMPRAAAPRINAMPGAEGTAGHLVNHVCLAMTQPEYEKLQQRLEANGTPPGLFMEQHYGARGVAPKAFYFRDPDGNVFEARYY